MNSDHFIQLLAGSGILKKNIWSNYWHIWSNYWQLVEPCKRIYDPIIGCFIHNLDIVASDIHLPISILLIQILDVFFQTIPKSHYISSSFWMSSRIFTTVKLLIIGVIELRVIRLETPCLAAFAQYKNDPNWSWNETISC